MDQVLKVHLSPLPLVPFPFLSPPSPPPGPFPAPLISITRKHHKKATDLLRLFALALAKQPVAAEANTTRLTML